MDAAGLGAVTDIAATSATGAFGKVDAAPVAATATSAARQRREETTVELSAPGRIKSSLSNVQIAARALGDDRQTSSAGDVRKAANNFVKAFNSATEAGALAGGSRDSVAASSRDGASLAAIGADSTVASELKSIGITGQKDGTLAIDTRKFDAALQAAPDTLRTTLSRAGQQVDQIAATRLAEHGASPGAENVPGASAANPDNRQTEQQVQAAAQQNLAAQNSRIDSASGKLLDGGALAYQRIFSI